MMAIEKIQISNYLDITKYEPPEPKAYRGLKPGVQAPEVPGFPRYTDIENILRYPEVLREGEEVVITEKIHGANFRCGWLNGEFHVGSHHTFRKGPDASTGEWHAQGDTNLWWKVALEDRQGRTLQDLMKTYPGLLLFGEAFGDVQDLKYGCEAGQVKLRGFDICDVEKGRYMNTFDAAITMMNDFLVEPAPLLYHGPFSLDVARAQATGISTLTPHQMREGCVIRPIQERFDHRVGRVILKCINPEYLLRKGGTEVK